MTEISFRGNSPRVSPSAWLAPTATLIGAVEIADRASVFWGVVVRGDGDQIRVGEESNLQEMVVIHADPGRPATIGARVSVGHAAVLHGCTIEDDVLIGMSATVLNGAVIGTGSLIAAGAVVRENMVVPPGSLVAGVPAVVRRELSAEEREAIAQNAEHYVRLSGEYASVSDTW
ncbi:gamma carbonic anhydrase family protein [Promicromonospora sp. Populi]|uniref:gamma carbonic anhydrase family protein n=1 Tax=Promicromonospora sp. Populi TaxID=3239420 RepID=UPI0034E2524F